MFDFLIDIAEQGSIEEMLMAALPCMLSYSYIFRKISEMPEIASSVYNDLIQDYTEEVYSESCKRLYDFADQKCSNLSEKRFIALRQTESIPKIHTVQAARSHRQSLYDLHWGKTCYL